MDKKEFESQYLGVWKSDPELKRCIEILYKKRYLPEYRDFRVKDYFSDRVIRQAKMIIARYSKDERDKNDLWDMVESRDET